MVGRSFNTTVARIVAAGTGKSPRASQSGQGNSVRAQPTRHHDPKLFRRPAVRKPEITWPSLEFDSAARSTNTVSRFLPARFYYKMFIHRRSLWKHVYSQSFRHSWAVWAKACPRIWENGDTY